MKIEVIQSSSGFHFKGFVYVHALARVHADIWKHSFKRR